MEFKTKKNRILIFLTAISTIVYLNWRVFFTIPFGYGTFAVVWGIILLLVEFQGMLESIIHFHNMYEIEYPKRPDTKGKVFPHVDVFIATYNEPVDLLFKTINGCMNMDYPDKDKVHIYICDDSGRDEVKELADHMGINYISREDRKHAKAGNLNNALKHSTSPLVVTFDADMIPMHDFLLATVPYFLGEEKIGFVQTPQSFYNPDLFQFYLFSEGRIPNEQDYFYRDIQVSKNKSNSVIYGGSNTVISRAALEEIGGFYTEVITEDFATGMLIQSKGYRCYAINEIHASGLSPSDLKSLVKQRERWARGCIQTGRKLNILFRKGLNMAQKLSYISSITYWFSGLKRLVYIVSPILFGVFEVIVVKCTLFEALIFWLPMYVFNRIALKKLSKNIRTVKWTNIYETVLFPSLLPSIILESLCISQKKFSVTRKDKVEDDKRYNIRLAIPHVILAILSALALANCIRLMFKSNSISTAVVVFWLVINLYNIIMSIFFMTGRKMLRKSERFLAQEDCIISFDNKVIKSVTKDISETGIAVFLDKPEYIPSEVNIKIKVTTKRDQAEFIANVVHVEKINKKWKYAFNVIDIDEYNYRQLLNIIFDREPTLPKIIEDNSSVFDDIRLNILKRKSEKIFYSRKLARIDVDKSILCEDGSIVDLVNFNYRHIVIKYTNKIGNDINLRLSENINLNCTFEKDLSYGNEKLMLFRINNYRDVNKNYELVDLVTAWEREYEISTMNKKKNEAELDEFNEYNYL